MNQTTQMTNRMIKFKELFKLFSISLSTKKNKVSPFK